MGGSILTGALQGGMGGAALGPYGIAAGALIGGITGFFNGEKEEEAAKQQEEALKQQQSAMHQPIDLSYANAFIPTFAMGGLMPGMQPNAELEKEEVTQSPDGSMLKVNAPTHSQGGIQLPLQHGTMVFSDRLKTEDGKTYAEVADELRKKRAKYEKILNS